MRLFSSTADAFGAEMPSMRGVGFEDCLKRYALFTREKAEEAVRNGAESEVKQRLYQNAYHMGQGLREEFGVRSMKEAMKLARIIYGMIEINFRGEPSGDVMISRCYFSSFYSPEVCAVISSIDAGLLSGLSGGGRLIFQQRITEGTECCRASLRFGARST